MSSSPDDSYYDFMENVVWPEIEEDTDAEYQQIKDSQYENEQRDKVQGLG